jgi:hypothetical protein
VESSINSGVVGLSAIHHSAGLARVGEYEKARVNLVSNLRLLQRTMEDASNQEEYLSYIVQGEKLDGFMREAQQRIALGLATEGGAADDHDDDASKSIFQMRMLSRSLFRARA